VLSGVDGDDRPPVGKLAAKHARLDNLGTGSVAKRERPHVL
jgi:hypothetical protein